MKQCKQCGNETTGRKEYCNKKCADKNFYIKHKDKIRKKAKEYYERVKNTEEYKTKRRKYFSSWVEKNREKVNAYYWNYRRRNDTKKQKTKIH